MRDARETRAGRGGARTGGTGLPGDAPRSRTASSRPGRGDRGTGLPGDAPRSRTASSRPGRGDRGQVALEYLGFLPILLIVGLAGLQLGLAAYAAQQAGTAARAGARAASSDDEETPDALTAQRAAVSGWLDLTPGLPIEGDGQVTVTAVVRIPEVVPFWDFAPVQKTATMPLPQAPEEDDLP
ncbi:TadE/TadG family type IV pilus assembly protein [Streptomyces sp. NPDC058486]|uniref:TadE/TadG family type IV pilus assembly protein n=1 Tax=unclassified Streptomyces TaxID=2593676 RepID=UPI00365CC5CD